MNIAVTKQQDVLYRKGNTEDALQALENAAAYAPRILKPEWERVKRGEIPFWLARNLIAPLFFVVWIVILILLWIENDTLPVKFIGTSP